MAESDEVSVISETGGTVVREKILHVLKIYPAISPSMLQIGLGTSLPPTIWRPILSQLIDDKLVKMDEVPSSGADGRTRSYQILSLVNSQT